MLGELFYLLIPLVLFGLFVFVPVLLFLAAVVGLFLALLSIFFGLFGLFGLFLFDDRLFSLFCVFGLFCLRLNYGFVLDLFVTVLDKNSHYILPSPAMAGNHLFLYIVSSWCIRSLKVPTTFS
jgi:hypothetical protein